MFLDHLSHETIQAIYLGSGLVFIVSLAIILVGTFLVLKADAEKNIRPASPVAATLTVLYAAPVCLLAISGMGYFDILRNYGVIRG